MSPPAAHVALPAREGEATAATGSASLAIAFAICSVAALVPLWSVKYLPMTDLPQHAAQVSMWMHLHDPAFGFERQFELNWFTPYLLGYCLARGFAAVMSLAAAMKLTISLAVLATPAALLWLLREVDGEPWAALIGFPAAFGFSFYWGFLNFVVAIPMGVAFVAYAVRYARAPSLTRAAWLALASIALCLGHLLVFGTCALAAGAIVLAHAREVRSAFVRALPLAVPAPLILWWLVVTRRQETLVHLPTQWELGFTRLFQLLGIFFGRPEDHAAVAFGVMLIALALLAGIRGTKQPWRLIPVAVALAAYLFGPFRAFGTYYLFPRAAAFVLLFAAAAVEQRRGLLDLRGARVVFTFLIVSWLALLTARFHAFNREADDFDTVAAAMRPNARVLYLDFFPGSDAIIGWPFLHFPAWYQAEKGGVLGFSFATFFPELVRYRPGQAPRMTGGLEFRPEAFDWSEDGDYDYFVVRANGDVSKKLFSRAPSEVNLKAHAGRFWVYGQGAAR